jgi:hypothetical protein
MAIGRRLRLTRNTIGIESVADRLIVVTVPKDAIIELMAGPADNNKVALIWEGKALTMFAEDVRERGEEIATKRSLQH